MNDSEPQATRLADLSAPRWDELADVTVLLPLGSTEQHGAHMPLGADTAIAVAVSEQAGLLSARLVVAPPIPFGVSHHHRGLPGGAVSVPSSVLVDYLIAVLEELVVAQRRHVIVVNGHGGNWPAITLALDELGRGHGELPLAACSWWQLVADEIASEALADETGIGHAGAVETSVMLAVDATLVGTPDPKAGTRDRPEGTLGATARPQRFLRWIDFRRFPGGVLGTPTAARPDFGQTLVQLAAERLVALADELRQTATTHAVRDP